ncbi:methylmalonyl-CoA mutase [Siculibacillus lacustris]|uniref:methylmalonyl-CoA mutase n=1 Tax=Siculibacillus lacustris TaxID=1549641 RepID=A0A4Q9VXA8_9HYPH|nr:methylmalonyl-CoA mutase family protein [Siculibacillus lacustris]TBW41023.1 methylmalonyl-CoA mutase [Siculibacillus lacustris]
MCFTESFAARTHDDWVGVATKALKTTPLDRLKTTTADGIVIEPIYVGTEVPAPLGGRAAGKPWTVAQRIDIPEPKAANAQILDDLMGGAGGLDLVFAESPQAAGFGIAASCGGCIAKLLAGVHVDLVPIRVDAGARTAELAGLITAFATETGKTVDLALIQDPVGELAASGRLAVAAEAAIAAAAAAGKRFPGTVLEADGRVWHAAGASEAQELAGLIATAVTYLKALEAQGLDLAAAVAKIGFTAVADQNQFHSIAKLRALTLLWARIQDALGLAPTPARIHVETARRMMNRRDAHTNVLRTTIATFAAGVTGATSVTVLPYSSAVGLPDAFARRIARNTQTILIEESNLHRVADPAAGSGLVDTETHQLAELAWTLFQGLEAEGGIVAALRSGSFLAKVAAVAKKRLDAIAKRREPVTGISEFPNIAEREVPVIDAQPKAPAEIAAAETVAPFRAVELDTAFETLRDTADAVLAATGERPKLFFANLGRIADFTGRATWSKNFFEAGGIQALTNDGFASLDELIAAFKASGAKGAVIASSDAVYETQAVPAAEALVAAGASPIYLAGKPADADREATLRAAGVTGFIHLGQDVVAVLTQALAALGR